MKKLFIISNESVYDYENSFFCDNIDMKSTPEGLKNKFDISIIARKSKIKRTHKINVQKIDIFKNIFSYLFRIYKSLSHQNSKYLIISISPFTFLACILLFFFKKKPLVYLRSDGFEEYKSILGVIGPAIYYFMFTVTSKISNFIGCREYILRGVKGKIVNPSQIDNIWLSNTKKPSLDKLRLLYVGRVRIEKGVYSLLKILKNNVHEDIILSIVGAEKKEIKEIIQKNVNVYKIEEVKENLINYYDDHNVFILPSFTEGHPLVLLESLARLRPVIIFEEINYIVNNYQGIFVAKRNFVDFFKKINYIKNNYDIIQEKMKTNKIPTRNDFLKKLEKIIIEHK